MKASKGRVWRLEQLHGDSDGRVYGRLQDLRCHYRGYSSNPSAAEGVDIVEYELKPVSRVRGPRFFGGGSMVKLKGKPRPGK